MNLKRVLVVDDDQIIRRLLLRMLPELGVEEVVTAANAEEAVRKFWDGRYDLALVDVNLGSDNGIQLAKAFRDQAPQTLIKVMSGDVTNQEKVQEAGFGDLLSKPFTSKDLAAALPSN